MIFIYLLFLLALVYTNKKKIKQTIKEYNNKKNHNDTKNEMIDPLYLYATTFSNIRSDHLKKMHFQKLIPTDSNTSQFLFLKKNSIVFCYIKKSKPIACMMYSPFADSFSNFLDQHGITEQPFFKDNISNYGIIHTFAVSKKYNLYQRVLCKRFIHDITDWIRQNKNSKNPYIFPASTSSTYFQNVYPESIVAYNDVESLCLHKPFLITFLPQNTLDKKCYDIQLFSKTYHIYDS